MFPAIKIPTTLSRPSILAHIQLTDEFSLNSFDKAVLAPMKVPLKLTTLPDGLASVVWVT
jgi:hypothetical protein